jgi:Transglycosylase SLT domain
MTAQDRKVLPRKIVCGTHKGATSMTGRSPSSRTDHGPDSRRIRLTRRLALRLYRAGLARIARLCARPPKLASPRMPATLPTLHAPARTSGNRRTGLASLLAVGLALSSGQAKALAQAQEACLRDAALRHGLAPQLLAAISLTESGMNPKALSRNANGSHDIGLMQINSSWLPKLSALGITEGALWDPCVNVEVGAALLAHGIARLGYTWEAVGAYHARSPQRRRAYAWRVAKALNQIHGDAEFKVADLPRPATTHGACRHPHEPGCAIPARARAPAPASTPTSSSAPTPMSATRTGPADTPAIAIR